LTYLDWAIEFPMNRKASVLLNVSDLITADTRARAAIGRELIDAALTELEGRGALKGLPAGFAAATMSAMQESTMDFIAKYPKLRKELTERGFAMLWRAVR
jgi:hypothetical protein